MLWIDFGAEEDILCIEMFEHIKGYCREEGLKLFRLFKAGIIETSMRSA